MGFGLLGTTWTTENHTAFAISNSTLSISLVLNCESARASLRVRNQLDTHSVLAEGEGHVLSITTDFDENLAKFTKDLSDRHLQSILILMLE